MRKSVLGGLCKQHSKMEEAKFPCCGGTDETPAEHTQDCPVVGEKHKRHSWSRGNGWCVCLDCGCRYREGMMQREYRQPNGERTDDARECVPRLGFSGSRP